MAELQDMLQSKNAELDILTNKYMELYNRLERVADLLQDSVQSEKNGTS